MLLWTARHFDREAFDIAVVSLMTGGPFASLIRGEGVRVVEMDQRRGLITPGAILRLIRLVRGFSPRIIQGHLFHSNMLSRLIAPLVPGACSLSTRHNEKDTPLRSVFYRMTAPLSAGTVVFSEPVRRHATGDSPRSGEVRIVPYGIEIARTSSERAEVRTRLGIKPETFVWIAVGRLTGQKGFDLLLEAFSHLCREDERSMVLLLVGDGEDRAALQHQAAGSVPSGWVRFLGEREDVAELMEASDAFVLSSLWEGGPLVVLEAMAACLPVVATRVGDASNMVVEGETGLLVEAGLPAALTHAMNHIMDLGPAGRKWGKRGRERVESHFGFERTQKSLEDIYRDLLEP
ncbi:MAG: glycosyltransferase [bacterium]|nr:MAG: glycosyltransferase [bacterium]